MQNHRKFHPRPPRAAVRKLFLMVWTAALLALADSASAEIIGVETFDYPDGPIAGQGTGKRGRAGRAVHMCRN